MSNLIPVQKVVSRLVSGKKACNFLVHKLSSTRGICNKRSQVLTRAQDASCSNETADSSTKRSDSGVVTSPFAKEVQRKGPAATYDVLSIENADKALDQVRPMLIDDGGDVEVVKIQAGIIYLRLQGSCSTCSAQDETMKGGIETSLKNAFGSLLKDIILVDKLESLATVASVDGHLNMIRGAISGLGGKVVVLSVERGVCTLKYSGPKGVRKGVEGVIRERFTDINSIVFED